MSFPFIPIVCMYAALAGQLVCEQRNFRTGMWVFKPLASTAFIVAGLLAGALQHHFGLVMLVGLCLCWLGDVLLISRAKSAFLAGLVAFLLGHVAYAVAFVVRGVDWTWAGIALVLLALVAVPVLRWLMPNVEGGMRVPVIAYTVVISAMVALSVGSVAAEGGWLVPVGALAFYVSDLSVASDRFVKTSFYTRLWGLPLYYTAQAMLAVAIGLPYSHL